ncbi:MAG: hypothetical protein ABW101_12485 [Candidatus Thiodiazotropha sp.]
MPINNRGTSLLAFDLLSVLMRLVLPVVDRAKNVLRIGMIQVAWQVGYGWFVR